MHLLVVFIYFLTIIFLGVLSKRKLHNANDFILGGRNFSAVTTALGAGAADMSGWIMMALPGVVYLQGMHTIWYLIGLSLGAFLNWTFIAKKLRVMTAKLNNSQTISSYFSNRFEDKEGVLKIIIAVCTMSFYVVYMSSALMALGLIVEIIFSVDYYYALILSSIFIFIYISLGGFIAINWVDIMQGSLMLAALLVVPTAIFLNSNTNIIERLQTLDYGYMQFDNLSIVSFVSFLGWSLGYFGQPHILTRFMAIKDVRALKVSAIICLSWMIISLAGAFATGILSKLLFASVDNPELIFLSSAELLLNPLLVGFVLAAILSAVISTLTAQIHTTASTIVEDVIANKIKPKQKIFYLRLTIICLLIISALLALDKNNTILSFVSLAWAGLGSAIGPALLFSLYSTNITRRTAIYGIATGAIVTLLWHFKPFHHGIWGLYEIIPGFILSSLVIAARNHFIQD